MVERVKRPPLAPEVFALIAQMARENPLWSRRRIPNELAKLGYDVPMTRSQSTYRVRWGLRRDRRPRRGGHSPAIAIDFFTVPTVMFGVLYVFFVLSLESRRILHVNVTAHPYAAWAARRIVEAVGPRRWARTTDLRLRQDLGAAFDRRVENLGLTQLRIAPRSPWQNGFAERWVGTVRREIGRPRDRTRRAPSASDPPRVRRVLQCRPPPHVAWRRPLMRRDVKAPPMGRGVAMPKLGGVHHRYARREFVFRHHRIRRSRSRVSRRRARTYSARSSMRFSNLTQCRRTACSALAGDQLLPIWRSSVKINEEMTIGLIGPLVLKAPGWRSLVS